MIFAFRISHFAFKAFKALSPRFIAGILVFICFHSSFAQQTVGLISHTSGSLDSGYVLFSPQNDSTYLIDKCGKQVHVWPSDQAGGGFVYLLDDGRILRAGNYDGVTGPAGPPKTQLQDWDGKILWSYVVRDSIHQQHHDVCYLPNGHILCLVNETLTNADAIAAGRDTQQLSTRFVSEEIVELQPVGSDSAIVTWTWRAWEHLVQDYNPLKKNYATIAGHPELINVNYPPGAANVADWLHINSLRFNAAQNLIMVSVHNMNELWIIDHSTTADQARGHAGGRFDRGGDLIYRWGNPAAYERGMASQQKFFGQHCADWIPAGCPHEGDIIVFNNGLGRPAGDYTSIDIIAQALDSPGVHGTGNAPYLPNDIAWQYTDPQPSKFFCINEGGVQMLPNGNVLVCDGFNGTFFEVDTARNNVWKYVEPVSMNGPIMQGSLPFGNTQFTVQQYPYSYPAFKGRALTAGAPIEKNPIDYACTLNILSNITIHEASSATITENVFVYPNPATNSININTSTKCDKLTLYNALGEKVAESRRTGTFNTMDMPSGLYSLVILRDGKITAKNISIVK